MVFTKYKPKTKVHKNMRHVNEEIKKMWQTINLHSKIYVDQYLYLPFSGEK